MKSDIKTLLKSLLSYIGLFLHSQFVDHSIATQVLVDQDICGHVVVAYSVKIEGTALAVFKNMCWSLINTKPKGVIVIVSMIACSLNGLLNWPKKYYDY